MILGLSVSPANHAEGDDAVDTVDQAIEQAAINPDVVCADSSYGSGYNRAAFEKRSIRFVSPPRKPFTHTGRMYFTTEDFEYDEVKDEFICPAGQRLSFIAEDKQRPDRRRYRCWLTICKDCHLKGKCTKSSFRRLKVSADHAALIRLRADSKTESFKQLYRSRAPVVEGVFGEAKQWHSLGRAWRRGLSKMRVQCLLVAAAINLKRLVALLLSYFSPIKTYKSALQPIGS